MRLNRYRFDPMALIAGAVFTGIAVAYLLRATGAVSVSPQWVLATAAIGVGLAGLAGALWALLPKGGPEPVAAPMRPMASTTTSPESVEQFEQFEQFEPGASSEPTASFASTASLEPTVSPGSTASLAIHDVSEDVAEPYADDAAENGHGAEAAGDAPGEDDTGDDRPDPEPPTVDLTK
ncbi:hypothetical protein OG948_22505 [Embleya sp. NBC_00888]|uniref:hypothetical protein n=1 Tax=Embleya sp. NBC_00888 TaxID=2975960 RepID=UPI00386E8951|nr:hypothetical protein OG948_22505 [Embleya sp. NBC_00888]